MNKIDAALEPTEDILKEFENSLTDFNEEEKALIEEDPDLVKQAYKAFIKDSGQTINTEEIEE